MADSVPLSISDSISISKSQTNLPPPPPPSLTAPQYNGDGLHFLSSRFPQYYYIYSLLPQCSHRCGQSSLKSFDFCQWWQFLGVHIFITVWGLSFLWSDACPTPDLFWSPFQTNVTMALFHQCHPPRCYPSSSDNSLKTFKPDAQSLIAFLIHIARLSLHLHLKALYSWTDHPLISHLLPNICLACGSLKRRVYLRLVRCTAWLLRISYNAYDLIDEKGFNSFI